MADIIGKVFEKAAAVEYYGEVRTSATIETEVLKELLTQTKEYIMIRENNGQVEVLDNARNPLYPKGLEVKSDEVFNVYSTEKLEELLSKSNDNICSVEQRLVAPTITTGTLLLEHSIPCPPNCPS